MSLLSSSSSRKYVFIEVDTTQQKNTPNHPPEDLEIEFPPFFNEEELGSKILRNQSNNCNNTTRVSSRRKPPNAFILFRKKYLDALHRRGQRYPMKTVSGWARDAWKSLEKYQKHEYESIATRAASLYHEWASSVPNKKRQSKNIRRNKPNNENNNTSNNNNYNNNINNNINNNNNKNKLSSNTATATTTNTTTALPSNSNNIIITKPTINIPPTTTPTTTISTSPAQKKIITNNALTPLSSANSSAINSPTSPVPSNNFSYENYTFDTVYNLSSSYFPSSSSLLTDNGLYYQIPDSQRTGLSSSSNDKLTVDEFVSPTMNLQRIEYNNAYLKDDNNNNPNINDNDANVNYSDSIGTNDPSNQYSSYYQQSE